MDQISIDRVVELGNIAATAQKKADEYAKEILHATRRAAAKAADAAKAKADYEAAKAAFEKQNAKK